MHSAKGRLLVGITHALLSHVLLKTAMQHCHHLSGNQQHHQHSKHTGHTHNTHTMHVGHCKRAPVLFLLELLCRAELSLVAQMSQRERERERERVKTHHQSSKVKLNNKVARPFSLSPRSPVYCCSPHTHKA